MTMPPGTVPGFDKAETFRNQVEFGDFFRRLIPMLVMIFVVAVLMIAFILSAAKLGGVVAWGVALPVSAGICALLYQAKKKQFAASWTKATLELSPYGAVMSDPSMRVELPWQGIHRIGDAQLLAPLKVNVANEALADVAYAAAAATAKRNEEGLIGAGTMTLSGGASRTLRAQVAQNDAGQPADPKTGQPPRAIILTHYDPNWRAGRIGQWIRAYRPDLLG